MRRYIQIAIETDGDRCGDECPLRESWAECWLPSALGAPGQTDRLTCPGGGVPLRSERCVAVTTPPRIISTDEPIPDTLRAPSYERAPEEGD